MRAHTQKTLRLALLLFVLIVFLMAADVWDDYEEGQSYAHISVELLVVLCSMMGIALLGKQYIQVAQDKLYRLQHHLAEAEAETERWRERSKTLMQGLGQEIQKQFDRWELTQAESEIGLLMLKGFSHQEIAEFRQASERTVREQARVVYRKAGLNNKAELSAFFLEDLLLPESAPAAEKSSDTPLSARKA